MLVNVKNIKHFVFRYLITFRYIKLIAYICARHIQISREESHKYRYRYYYALQFILGGVNKFLILFLTGLLLNILPQLFFTTLSFILLRVFAGGLHLNSYSLCTYFSLLTFTATGLLAKYIHPNQLIDISIFLFTYFAVLKYAPVAHPNRPITFTERKKFKIIALFITTVLFIISMFLCFNVNLTIIIPYINVTILNREISAMINNSITYGILLAGLITLPVVNKLK